MTPFVLLARSCRYRQSLSPTLGPMSVARPTIFGLVAFYLVLRVFGCFGTWNPEFTTCRFQPHDWPLLGLENIRLYYARRNYYILNSQKYSTGNGTGNFS